MQVAHLLFDASAVDAVERFLCRPAGGVILSGKKGLGKHLLAKHMAMQMLGVSDMGKLPFHPDFVEVRPVNQAVKLEDLEPVRRAAALSAVDAGRKVFLIDDADLMTPAAQNSLLKLLEGLGDRNVAILVCHGPLLKTVRSRCHYIGLYPAMPERMAEYLAGNGLQAEELAAAIAGGCIGKYFSYCEKGEYLSDVRGFFSALTRNSKSELLLALSMMKEKDKNSFFEKYSMEEVREFLQLLGEVFNEMLLRQAHGCAGRGRFSSFVDVGWASQRY